MEKNYLIIATITGIIMGMLVGVLVIATMLIKKQQQTIGYHEILLEERLDAMIAWEEVFRETCWEN